MKNINILKKSQDVSLYTNNDLCAIANEYDSSLFAQSVHVHLQNRRQGTVMAKDRSLLISRSNKKPWRQKGTGKARCGTARSPLWRGGAVALAPVPRVRVLSMPRKMKKLALQSVIGKKIALSMVGALSFEPTGRVKDAIACLKKNTLHDKKIVLFYDKNDQETYFSFINVQMVQLMSYDAVFPYGLGDGSLVLFLEKDRQIFEEMVQSWQ